MAKIVEILETERKRPTAADFNIVHMYKTGSSTLPTTGARGLSASSAIPIPFAIKLAIVIH